MKNHLFRLTSLLALCVLVLSVGARAAEAGEKRIFVLVHGATAGGWEWKKCGKFLTDDGHTVYRATLTGLGERLHLNSPDIDLQTHINDVVNLILFEDLHNIVLTGHSYGGMVITGAADALLSAGRTHLHALVYVDAMVPLPGEAWGSRHSAEVRAQRSALAQANDNALPPGDPAAFGLEGADRDWLLRRQVAHPFAGYGEPLDFDEQRLAALPRHFIDCNQPAYPTINPSRQRVRSTPGWQVVEIATGHCPMVSASATLVTHLLAMAGD